MASDRTPDQKIADAQRIENFLRDDAVRYAIELLESKYIEEMIAADNGEKRAHAQGKIQAVRGLAGALAALVGEGAHEIAMRELQEKFVEQKKKGLLA